MARLKTISKDAGLPTDALVKMGDEIDSATMRRVKTAMRKNASMTKYAAGISVTPPSFYNPLYTSTSLQLPRDRKQINVWSFAPGTQILMADGNYKSIEDIEIDELVISGNGNMRPITHKYVTQVNKEMVTAETSESSISITHDHGCYVIGNEDIEKAISSNNIELYVKEKYASELKEDDWFFRPIVSTRIKQNIDKDLAYLLGAYLAEGYVSIGRQVRYDRAKPRIVNLSGNVELKYGLHELNIVNKIKTICQKFEYPISVSKTKNCFRVWIRSSEFAKLCLFYCGKGSKNKKLAKNIQYAQKDILAAFVSGYIDGDGHQVKQNGVIAFATASKTLADQFQSTIFPRLGIVFGRNDAFVKARQTDTKRHYAAHFNIPKRYASLFFECSKTLITDGWKEHLSNKKRIINNSKTIFSQIKKITRQNYIGNVHDITVEKDFNLIANNFSIKNCRHFFNTEPIPFAAISLYSDIPITDYRIDCPNAYVKKFFEDMCKHLKMLELLHGVALEYFLIGDVFPMAELDEEKKTWKRVVLINPDFVDVRRNMLAGEPVIEIIPDEDLKKIIWEQQPRETYEYFKQFLPDVIQAVKQGKNIQVNPDNITHLRHKPIPYNVYGMSLLKPIFKILMYTEMIRRAQFVIAERYVTPLKIFKLGTMDEPPTPADIAAVQAQLDAVIADPSLVLVTTQRLTADWQGISGKTLNLNGEYDFIERWMFTGLGLPRAMVNGEGQFAAASIGGNAFLQRIENFRVEIKTFIEERLFRPICILNNFYDKDPDTDEDYLVIPEFKWDALKLQDEAARQQALMALRQQNMISAETLLNEYHIDFESEAVKLINERDTIFDINRVMARQIAITQGLTMSIQQQFAQAMQQGAAPANMASVPGVGSSPGYVPPSQDALSGMTQGPSQFAPMSGSNQAPIATASLLKEMAKEIRAVISE